MKIFLSWSGDRSRAVAEALHKWLRLATPEAVPWFSHTGIEAGRRWSIEIAKQLEASEFAIICLTRENLASPWIFFEAGAVSRKMLDGVVVPYPFKIDHSDYNDTPLSQFQGKTADKKYTLDLVKAINNMGAKPEDDAILVERFGSVWPILESALKAIPESAEDAKPRRRDPGDQLDEIIGRLTNLGEEMATVKASVQASHYPGTFVSSGLPSNRLQGLGKSPPKGMKLTREKVEAFVNAMRETMPMTEADLEKIHGYIDSRFPKIT